MNILGRGLKIGRVFSFVLLLAAWGAVGAGTNAFPQGSEASEYQVKAAFLYNFAKFVEWPPDVPSRKDDPIRICIVGENPFGNYLNESTEEKTINGRKLVIWELKSVQDAKGCQIVFIGASEKYHLRASLESMKGAPVLTVGDTEGFAQAGGMINFTLEENMVRFEVNVDAAERARLKISSKLLSLAKVVKSHDQVQNGMKSRL